MPVPVVIADLSLVAASNFPAGSDTPSALDDTQRAHASFIALLRDGKAEQGAIQAQSYTAVTTVGSSTAYVVATLPVQPSLVAGQRYRIKLHTPNGVAPTLVRDGLAAAALRVYNSAGAKVAPAVAALPTLFDVEYDGADYVVLTPLPGAEAGANGTITSLSGLTTPLSIAQGGTGSAIGAAQIISQPNPTLTANALTLPASTLSLAFRSATASDGVVPAAVTGTVAALTIPSTATLGTVSAVASSIIEVVMNNAGSLERAVVNLAGGSDLSETGVISTTAISAAATSASVFYSNTARTNLPYRVVRRIDSTQATAGAWVATPSLVQGVGGQALAAMSSLGYGQTWQSVTRTSGVTYYNSTGKPIMLLVTLNTTSFASITVNGLLIQGASFGDNSGQAVVPLSCIIPINASYIVTIISGTARSIAELR